MKDLSFIIIRIFIFITAFTFFSCVNKTSGQEEEAGIPENDFTVIAYYTGSTGEIDEETAGQLDQIIYSFLHLDGNKLDISKAGDSTSLAYLTSLKKGNQNLKVLVSMGGWGGCETCSEVFSTEEGRREFAASVKNILEHHNSDGIDLDWEYPVVEGFPGHPFQPEDRENFTALVKELRRTLGPGYEISFAAGGFDEFMERAIEWEKVMPLLDRVNLMSYDLVNGGSALTGHHTPLYSTPQQILSADRAINYLDSLGIPREKIVIGAAFYARVWEAVDTSSNGLYRPGKFKEAILYRDLKAFENANPGFIRYYDSIAQAPYSFNREKGLFATYDDAVSIAAKTKYVIEKGLGGIMFWQLSGDQPENGLLDVIDDVKKNETGAAN